MSPEITSSLTPPSVEQLTARVSCLQVGLSLVATLSLLIAVPLAGQRPLLLAVAVVCLLFILFDYAMSGATHSLSEAAATAHAELVADIERELHLDSDSWYVPTESGAVRRWHASTEASASSPPMPLPSGAFHDAELAGVSVPTIGWALLQQTDVTVSSNDATEAIEEALTVCQQTELVTEWALENHTMAEKSTSVFDIRVTMSRDGTETFILSLLGTTTASVSGCPIQVVVTGAEQRQRSVTVRVLSSGQ